MRKHLQNLLRAALVKAKLDIHLPLAEQPQIERTRDRKHGDFACNIAMLLAKQAKTTPRELANAIVKNIATSDKIERVTVDGPGFINFFLKKETYLPTITRVLNAKKDYGRSNFAKNRTALIEFVSANPTGPLHIGHGRSAAYGDCIANLLEAVAYQVKREYYINDTGRQIDILVLSIWLRYIERCGIEIKFPTKGYQGDYIHDIAKILHDKYAEKLLRQNIDWHNDQQDEEMKLDALLASSKSLLGEKAYSAIRTLGLEYILDNIRQDLSNFNVIFSSWFSESTLADTSVIEHYIDILKDKNYIYQKDGALWFRSTAFGDVKDRVIVRSNGQSTYFSTDIAYHLSKLSRNYDILINIWGSDHHGYIPRLRAALAALSENAEKLTILLVQFATLYQGKEKIPMSTRSGQFITLRQLCDEVGTDAARFFYVMRKCEQHLEFDLDLAKSKSRDNPIYYIQYAHARVCSVMVQLQEHRYTHDIKSGTDNLLLLTESEEYTLAATLDRYPEIIHAAATAYEPHRLAYYLRELANEFHVYYNSCHFLVPEKALRNARLNLICAVRQVLYNGLNILGISALEKM